MSRLPTYALMTCLLFLHRSGAQVTWRRGAQCGSFIFLRNHHVKYRAVSFDLSTTRLRQNLHSAKKQLDDPSDPSNIYRDTVTLPKSTFDQRANAVVREPQIHQFWETEGIYRKLHEGSRKKGAPKFVLHDGPPYANGDLHIGHALNKILKDFINRYKVLQGFEVRYVPGWDCHGLPIELKVLQSLKQADRQALTPISLRLKARDFALETVERQRASFKRYGIMGDWQQPYLTLQPEYEAAQIRAFGDMVLKGHIYRGLKPVHWSPSSRTALAEAELEYPEDHVSKSIYVGFPVTSLEGCPGAAALSTAHPAGAQALRVAVWTTTPWTIPANLAVAVNTEIDYSLVTHSDMPGEAYLVATDLVDKLAETVFKVSKGGLERLATLKGRDLVGLRYRHPLIDRESQIVEGGDYITTETGTGLVHTAPGHGQEDYLTGIKYGLPLLSPVDDAGRFTEEAGERFEGKDVLGDGNLEVIQALNETGALILMEPYHHKYPYDWRTKKPTIFRATDQWFASVDSFRQDALAAIDTVTWLPDVGKKRISTMTASRSDWCISRQRSWGVPIPVFYHVDDGSILMDDKTISHLEGVFREHGSDAWWTMEVADLLPIEYRERASLYLRGTDTMDVWFDSGSSWAGVLKNRKDDLQFPADVYLEGVDQHRGWFQSSLLTSVAATGVAPYKAVVTHGFVLDEKGYKMSKSLGNVVDPIKVIEGGNNKKQDPAYGADVLRLWVSSVDYSSDVCVGGNILKQVGDAYRKLRNTARYLVGNLHDFDPDRDAVPYDSLPRLDKYILGRLSMMIQEVEDAFETFQFSRANQALQRFAVADLSNFYLDVAKDRLYIAASNDERRRTCQTTMRLLLEGMATAMSPVLPHMAEDIWQNLPYARPTTSIFQAGWIPEQRRFPSYENEEWSAVLRLRDDVNKCMEAARREGLIGASLEAAVYVYAHDPELCKILDGLMGDNSLKYPPTRSNGVDDLRFLLLASQVHIVSTAAEVTSKCEIVLNKGGDAASGATVGIRRASGKKCSRCWYYGDLSPADATFPHICSRCVHAVTARGGLKLQQPIVSISK